MAIIVPIVAKFIDEGIKDAKKQMTEATSRTQRMGAAISGLAGPAKAAGIAMGGAMLTMAKNAGASEKANVKLGASFKAVGYPQNTKAAIKYAEAMQFVVGISDEEIKATMQKLAAFEHVAKSQDMMARATMAAADMAAAGFGTMDSAATALGKALNAPEKNLGALTRMGVTFTKQEEKNIKAMAASGDMMGAQALIMEKVEGKFAGIAETSASGTNKMKLAWDEASEAIGMAFRPALETIIKLLAGLAIWVQKNADFVGNMMVAFLTLTAVIVAADVAMKVWTVAVKIGTVAMKIFGITSKAAAGWIGLLVMAVVVAAILIIKNWDKIKAATTKTWNAIVQFLNRIWESIKTKVQATWDAIVSVISKAWAVIKRIVSVTPFGLFIRALAALVRIVIDNWDKIKSTITKAWGKIKGLFKTNPFTAIKGWLETLKGWFTSAFDAIWSKVQDVLDNVKGAVDNIKSAVKSAKELADKMPRPGKNTLSAGVAPRVVALPITSRMVGGVPVPSAGAVAGKVGGDAGITINVNGALDPEAVARQIRKLLDTHDRRNGRTVLRAVAF